MLLILTLFITFKSNSANEDKAFKKILIAYCFVKPHTVLLVLSILGLADGHG